MDDLAPREIAETLTNKVSEYKFSNKLINIFILGFLAGVYIAFGGLLSNLVAHDSAQYFGYGVSKLISGAVFSLALILVVITGAELFTGNTLMVTAVLNKRATTKELIKRWGIVFIANLLGAIFIVVLYYLSDSWKTHDLKTAINSITVAAAKTNLTFWVIFTRAIMANWLVCLAVYLAIASKSILGKIIAIMIPVSAFVALGFEHSIANMYFIPMGILLKGTEAAQNLGIDLSNLTLSGFINNLIPATLGNIIGGEFFVGVLYWFVYAKKNK